MKKTLTFFLLIPVICKAQVQFNFENHGMEGWVTSRTSAWDTSSTDPLSGRKSLKHMYDNPEAGHDQVSICTDSLHMESGKTEWEFMVRHGYNSSSSNNWSVYLVSDQDATGMFPGGNATGYAIGVNYTGSDDLLKLWKINRGWATPFITTGVNWQELVGTNRAGIKVIRSPEGDWEIYVKTGDLDYIPAGEGNDVESSVANHFGIYYEYSSSQDRKLWVDDIRLSGIFLRDTLPPALLDLRVTGKRSLSLIFSEPLDTGAGLSASQFFIDNEIGFPEHMQVEEANNILLFFSRDFPDESTCFLTIHGIADLKGNISSLSQHEFVYYSTGWFDIIIHEIMADPSPPVGLPEFEYIELMNRGSHHADLEDWTIRIGNTLKTFPEISMDAGAYLLLVHEDAEYLFQPFGPCLPVFTSRTSLANSGGIIELRDREGRLISWENWSDEWHENEYYREGGWSLEKIDTERFCGGRENWQGSKDPSGGTPGRINSGSGTAPDTLHPEIEYIEIPDERTIVIFFSEPMDSITQLFSELYRIEPGIGNPVNIELRGPDYRSVILTFAAALEEGIIYKLFPGSDLKDCSGNIIQTYDSIRFARPELPDEGDILISEVMFDPFPGKPEFIEIYNHSAKTIDLNNILLAERDLQSGGMTSFTQVYQTHRLLFPGEFLLLTKDQNVLLTGYPEAGGIISGMPDIFSLDDREGGILILDKWLQVLDEFRYSSDMHFSLLTSTEGVSLERISYDIPAGEQGNWHSTSKEAGFCTPGKKNSQFVMMVLDMENRIEVGPEIFTPDNDGRADVTNICYLFDTPGNVMSIWIYDPMGRIIRRLVVNMLPGTSGCITWDGTDDNGGKARMGVYLIYVRIFDLKGRVSQVKKTCVLSIRK